MNGLICPECGREKKSSSKLLSDKEVLHSHMVLRHPGRLELWRQEQEKMLSTMVEMAKLIHFDLDSERVENKKTELADIWNYAKAEVDRLYPISSWSADKLDRIIGAMTCPRCTKQLGGNTVVCEQCALEFHDACWPRALCCPVCFPFPNDDCLAIWAIYHRACTPWQGDKQ